MQDIRGGACPVCKHNKIIRAWPSDNTGDQGAFSMALTRGKSWMGAANRNKPVGQLYVCACRRCGHSQFFTCEPEKVPIGEEHGTTLLIGREPCGPYR